MKKLLFVCTGNTCRSPMAEVLCREGLEQAGLSEEVCCISRGLQPIPGDGMNPKSVAALEELGIQPGTHMAQPLMLDTLQQADLVFVMTQSHKELLTGACPEAEHKIRVLDVPDPFGGTMEDYRACRDQLRLKIDGIISDIIRKVQ